MIFGLFRRRKDDPAVEMLHGAIVRQSRHPSFYIRHGVSDTVDGRYDLLILHTFLIFRRLSAEPGGHDLAQRLCDHTFLDLDRSLREMGVGDMSISKNMKKLARKFYGRVEAYEQALARDDTEALARALDRNVYRRDGEVNAHSLSLADYVRAAALSLEGQSLTEDPQFPDPDPFQARI